MYEKVVKVLEKYRDKDTKEITPESSLQSDLKLNSLDVVNIIVEFEDMFDISISDDEIMKIVRVRDIVDCLERKLQ